MWLTGAALGGWPSTAAALRSLRAFAACAPLGDLPATLAFTYTGRSVHSLVAVAEGREGVGQVGPCTCLAP